MKVILVSETLRQLVAEDNMWLVNKADGMYFSKIVYLGSADSPDNYREISDDEKAKLEEEKKEEFEENIEDDSSDQ